MGFSDLYMTRRTDLCDEPFALWILGVPSPCLLRVFQICHCKGRPEESVADMLLHIFFFFKMALNKLQFVPL